MSYYNQQQYKQPYGGGRSANSRGPREFGDQGGYGGAAGAGGYGGYGMGGGGGHQQRGGYQNGAGSGGNTIWMGNIDESMDEQSIQFAFNSNGINVQNIKIIRNKETGAPVGYGFITFEDRNTAQSVLRELNGKKIPNTSDDKNFFLKPANRQTGGPPSGGGGGSQRLSIFVGNLTPEIDDEILYSAFASCYQSVSSAKVITADGQSKGYGFVNFDDDYDYQTALSNPNMMLGQTPITISRARQSNNGGGGGRPRYDGNGTGGGAPRGGGAGGDMRQGGGPPRRQPPPPNNY